MKITLEFPDEFRNLISQYTKKELSLMLQKILTDPELSQTSLASPPMTPQAEGHTAGQLDVLLHKVNMILEKLEQPRATPAGAAVFTVEDPYSGVTDIASPDISKLDFGNLQELEVAQSEADNDMPNLDGLRDFLKSGG